MEYQKDFKINGIISTKKMHLTEDDLQESFYNWCDQNSYIFSGSLNKNN